MVNGYLIDSNHASALIDNRIGPTRAKHPNLPLFLPATVAAELWFMVYNSERIEINDAKVRPFIARFGQLAFEGEVTEEYGRLRAELRRAGRPIPFLDIQIAATARHFNLIVLTADHHFDAIEKLTIENWLT